MNNPIPLVGIVMGSDSDWPVMRACAVMLKRFDVPYEAKVLSAHRTPEAALDYAAGAQERGIKVLIGAAGGAAHLLFGREIPRTADILFRCRGGVAGANVGVVGDVEVAGEHALAVGARVVLEVVRHVYDRINIMYVRT